MKGLQYQMSNGDWRNAEKREDLIEQAAQYNKMSHDGVIINLQAGKVVRLGTDWYEKLRIAPPEKPVREIPWTDDRPDYDEWEY